MSEPAPKNLISIDYMISKSDKPPENENTTLIHPIVQTIRELPPVKIIRKPCQLGF
jgi:hypothetical protein